MKQYTIRLVFCFIYLYNTNKRNLLCTSDLPDYRIYRI